MNPTTDVAITADDTDSSMQPVAFVSTESNEFSFNLSRTLVRQLDNMAKYEGISALDLVIELVTEGVARRIAEDQSRPAPSHLMTRNGYVQDQANAQPTMSHHNFQSNGNARDTNSQNRHQNNYSRNNHSNNAARPQSRYQQQNRNNSRPAYFNKSSKKTEG